MPPLPLIQGAYQARSVIANAQRCVNLYPEQNTKDAEVPITHYQTPGLTLLAQGEVGEVRQLYTASDGKLFGVIGSGVYYINEDWVLRKLGDVATQNGHCSMYDDRTTLIVLDGSAFGWSVDLTTLAFAIFNPSNFVGGNQIRYINTFLVSSNVGANVQASNSAQQTYEGLSQGAPTGDADKLQIIETVHKEVWVFGRRTTEIWTVTGDFPFPLAPIPGAFIQHGIAAVRSLAKWDTNVFWVSQDNNGKALVLMGTAYKATPISTPAIADAIGKYTTISDAIGYCYQQGSHIFYVLTFPTGNETWVYDLSTEMWHQRAWTDSNGKLNRHRGNCCAIAYNKIVVGDWQNGKLYEFDLDNYTDFGGPISRIRSFPHLVSDGNRVEHKSFMCDIEVGTIESGGDPQISLRWSDDRGVSFGNAMMQSLGKTGAYRTVPSWNRLGVCRDRVYELSWSEPCAAALNGAWIDAEPAET